MIEPEPRNPVRLRSHICSTSQRLVKNGKGKVALYGKAVDGKMANNRE